MGAVGNTRRDFLKLTGAGGASLAMSGWVKDSPARPAGAVPNPPKQGCWTLEKGQTFNESVAFPDEVTMRPTRKLTSNRDYNQTPTYHLGAGFSKDSQYLVMITWMKNGGSALLRAEVRTGRITVVDTTAKENPKRFWGNDTAMVAAGDKIAAVVGGKILNVYDLHTLQKKVLIEIPGQHPRFGHPCFGHATGSVDGRSVIIPRIWQDKKKGWVSTTYLQVDIASRKITELFTDEGSTNAHITPNPASPELFLIDRNMHPIYKQGVKRRKVPRCNVLNITTRQLTPIAPLDNNNFPIHSNWSFDGKHVYYQGISEGRDDHKWPPRKKEEKRGYEMPASAKQWYKDRCGLEHYIGVADVNGNVVWEGLFPYWYTGHACSHSTKPVFITGGLITRDLVTAIYWTELNSLGIPRYEIIGKHGTDWSEGQQSHPHCLVSPDGRWLSYNRGYAGRSDVYVIRLT